MKAGVSAGHVQANHDLALHFFHLVPVIGKAEWKLVLPMPDFIGNKQVLASYIAFSPVPWLSAPILILEFEPKAQVG